MMQRMEAAEASVQVPSISPVLIALFRGVLDRDEQPGLWQSLLRLEGRVREVVALFGLDLMLDETDGYAYVKQRSPQEGEEELPRLIPRRQLTYSVSLLLALLRKKLAEHDASGANPRLILTRDQIVELVRIFLADTGDEVKLLRRIDGDINKVVELGFLRRLRGQTDRFEVRRLLASFVDAQWLSEMDQRLAEYREYAQREDE